MYWKVAPKERIRTLGRVQSFCLESLKKVAEGVFEVEVKDGEILISFMMIVSYCGDISEANDLSVVRHGAEGHLSCVSRHSNYEREVWIKLMSRCG